MIKNKLQNRFTMQRIDNTCFLLFIEPKKEEKLEIPLDDELSQIMKVALTEAKRGKSNYSKMNEMPYFFECRGYKGYHGTDCGERSFPADYLLKNGMITNSLAVFYLRYYRNAIPESEMEKVMKVVTYYKEKYRDNPEKLIPKSMEDRPMSVDEWFNETFNRLFDGVEE
jgi:hypothetical protein